MTAMSDAVRQPTGRPGGGVPAAAVARWAPPLAAAAALVLLVLAGGRELHTYHLRAILRDLATASSRRVLAALALTLLGHLARGRAPKGCLPGWTNARLDGAGIAPRPSAYTHSEPREVFMDSRAHRVPLAVMAGLALASCGSDKPPAAAAATPDSAAVASAAPAAVTVITTNYSFDAPAQIPAGLTTFHLVNRGPSIHHVQLVKLNEGKTVDDFMAALKAGGPPPTWATMEGGPNPAEVGDTSTTTVKLEPGNYAMLCFVPDPDGVPHVAKGMARPLTVTAGTGAAASEPKADVVMKLVDYGFELSKPIPAGRHTIRVENAGPQEHEVVIVKLDSGKQAIDFAKWGEKMVGKPPGTLHGGVSGIMPGGKAFVEVNLPPGEYGLLCFVPDSKDGKGHYLHGMAKNVTVS